MVLTITYWMGKLVSHTPVPRQRDLLKCRKPIALLSMWVKEPTLFIPQLYFIENISISFFNSIFIYHLMAIADLEFCLSSPQVGSLTKPVKAWCCFMRTFFSMAFFLPQSF